MLGSLIAIRPAQAQTKLYLLFPGSNVFCQAACSPSVLLEVSVDERRILRQTSIVNAREWAGGPAVTADGRLVAWLGTERSGTRSFLSAFDLVTGIHTSLLDVASPWISGSLYADQGSLKLYGQLGGFPNGPITVVEPHGIRTVPDPCPGVGLVGMSGNDSDAAMDGGRQPVDGDWSSCGGGIGSWALEHRDFGCARGADRARGSERAQRHLLRPGAWGERHRAW